jgi:hypothetical protein
MIQVKPERVRRSGTKVLNRKNGNARLVMVGKPPQMQNQCVSRN